jgi:hypothetical protein
MIMLFTGSAMAQQLSGESAPFVFDTREVEAIPLSPMAVVIAAMLVVSFMLYRFWKKYRGANA